MKTPLCIIGNSHVAALRHGWNRSRAAADFTPDYLVGPNDMLTDLSVQDGRLAGNDPEVRRLMVRLCDKAEIDIPSYSAFLIVGMSIGLIFIGQIYTRHRLPQHGGERFHTISEAVFEEAVRGAVETSAGAHTLAELRKATRAPITLVPEPLLNARILDDERAGWLWQGDHVAALFEAYQREARRMAAAYDADIVFQPGDTVVPPAFTHPDYGKGAINVWRDKPYKDEEREFRHMNPTYGARMLDAALPTLSARLTVS